MRVLVTGASGFVGSALVQRLATESADDVTGAVRRDFTGAEPSVRYVRIADCGPSTSWGAALHGIDVVVHTAARAHIVKEVSSAPLAEFRRVNVEGTLNLAMQAAEAGVKRLVYISSVKVHGECTPPNRPCAADDALAPADPYGVSKREAEEGLRALCRPGAMEIVVIRPPLVYGPGVKANFLSMMRWLHKGVPLPFGNIENRRSFVALDNLVDLIRVCIEHPAASNDAFLVSDGSDLSTTELLRRLGRELGQPARLVAVPTGLLELTATALGRREELQRLTGWLQVDITKTRRLLAWRPIVTVEEGLRKTAQDFVVRLAAAEGT